MWLCSLAEGMTGTALRDELHSRDAWGSQRYTSEEVEWVVTRVAYSLLMVRPVSDTTLIQ